MNTPVLVSVSVCLLAAALIGIIGMFVHYRVTRKQR